jgi:hypothetical protein
VCGDAVQQAAEPAAASPRVRKKAFEGRRVPRPLECDRQGVRPRLGGLRSTRAMRGGRLAMRGRAALSLVHEYLIDPNQEGVLLGY